MTSLENRARLDPDRLAALAAAVREHATLEQVVRWGLAHRPARVVTAVVVQDEYTHDVVLPLGDAVVLVYDTT